MGWPRSRDPPATPGACMRMHAFGACRTFPDAHESDGMTRIVVDAMGGDHAPAVVVDGCVEAAREDGISLVVTGPEDIVRPLFETRAGGKGALAMLPIRFVDAPEVIGMDERPVPAIRRKRRSSILVGLKLVRDGEAQAFFSAGNTGAIMAASALVIGRLPGVERPALAALLPNSKGHSLLVDVGANVDAKAQHLEQWAIMGACYVRKVRGVASPSVALLSIGEEDVKGNELLRRVHQDLRRAPVNFIGNIDGKQVFTGHADVIVTDGFTGNALLKGAESLLHELTMMARREISASLAARIGYLFMKPALGRLKRVLDHSEYGAVPLLGVAFPVFIGHGSSTSKSIRSAIRQARLFAEGGVNEAMQQQLKQFALASREAEPSDAPPEPAGEGPAGEVPAGGEPIAVDPVAGEPVAGRDAGSGT